MANMKIAIEFRLRGAPETRIVERKMAAVPRAGEWVEPADGYASGVVDSVVWLHDGSPRITVTLDIWPEFLDQP